MAEIMDSFCSGRDSGNGGYKYNISRKGENMRVFNISGSPNLSLDIKDDLCDNFIIMDIGEPVTITAKESFGRSVSFTTYLIRIETNCPTFSKTFSAVRRRYSEFSWLRNHLVANYPEETLPSLPPKKYLRILNFNSKVIDDRRKGFCRFLQRVLETSPFLGDSALVLFLQSDLTVNEIEEEIRNESSSDTTASSFRNISVVEVSSSEKEEDDSVCLMRDPNPKVNEHNFGRSLPTESEGSDDRISSDGSCSSSASSKTAEDSGHFEEDSSSGSSPSLKHPDKGRKVIKSSLPPPTSRLPISINKKTPRQAVQFPPSMNDYMVFDPISCYLLGQPSI